MPTLTYAEIAEALKIAPASAYRLALRRRWPRTKGNDGRSRVDVPDEALTRHSDSTTVSQNDNQDDSHLTIARLEGELNGLREALIEARARAEQANTQLVAARADLAAETARTSQAIAAFESLTQRLEDLAQARRSWWRRLVG